MHHFSFESNDVTHRTAEPKAPIDVSPPVKSTLSDPSEALSSLPHPSLTETGDTEEDVSSVSSVSTAPSAKALTDEDAPSSSSAPIELPPPTHALSRSSGGSPSPIRHIHKYREAHLASSADNDSSGGPKRRSFDGTESEVTEDSNGGGVSMDSRVVFVSPRLAISEAAGQYFLMPQRRFHSDQC